MNIPVHCSKRVRVVFTTESIILRFRFVFARSGSLFRFVVGFGFVGSYVRLCDKLIICLSIHAVMFPLASTNRASSVSCSITMFTINNMTASAFRSMSFANWSTTGIAFILRRLSTSATIIPDRFTSSIICGTSFSHCHLLFALNFFCFVFFWIPRKYPSYHSYRLCPHVYARQAQVVDPSSLLSLLMNFTLHSANIAGRRGYQ